MGAAPHSATRRDWLKAVSAFGVSTLAPGVTLYAYGTAEKAKAGPRWGMLIDASRCVEGCNACVTACNTENGLTPSARPDATAQWIRKVSLADPATGRKRDVPVMCQHCSNPPCVDVCPTGASFKRDDGIVLVDKHICIGCRYCMMACPYEARSFVHEDHSDQNPDAPRGKGTVESCTMCVRRVDAGQIPACVEACKGKSDGAMMFGDLNDPTSAISKRIAELSTVQLRAGLQTDPGIRYHDVI
ncbi:MAG: 4Fe-4S dicluster domain-containing protein [Alphaproteobacteria bacterium]|nr:4Fe-4S dicluster domain-containing protein [Alphaproteobacteria bacterium]MDE2339671.1 4Fe-4S dicluster domain-containing protein [Alphaproteobacteria bacterium]